MKDYSSIPTFSEFSEFIKFRKTHRSLARVDELRIFLDISFVISKLFCTFVI